MKFTLVKRKYKREYLFMVIQGFANILDGLIMVLSFGFFVSGLALSFCKWRTLWSINKSKKDAKSS